MTCGIVRIEAGALFCDRIGNGYLGDDGDKHGDGDDGKCIQLNYMTVVLHVLAVSGTSPATP